MKKLSTLLIIAFALVLGLSQCKKKVDTIATPSDLGKTVHITVNVGGDKHDVFPNTGAVVYTDGDKIYVGDGSKYLGTLTYGSGAFSGDITEPAVGDYLYFYFLGGLTLDSPSAETTSYTVSIADQSSKLPVLSLGRSSSPYTTSSATYGCTLENKCALVNFKLSASTNSLVKVGGMKTEACIDFKTPGIIPTEKTGAITLNPESGTAKWAILLPIASETPTKVEINAWNYNVIIPQIEINDYLTGENAINVPCSDYTFTIAPLYMAMREVHFSPGNLQCCPNSTNSTPYVHGWRFAENQYDYVGDNTVGNVFIGEVKCSNNLIDATYTGWIDLFGWGAGNDPSKTITQDNWYDGYYWEDSGKCDLGDPTGNNYSWKVLSQSQWEYLLNHHRWGTATVNDVHGFVIIPSNNTTTSIDETRDSWDDNTYTVNEWRYNMENYGCVFLPAAGGRTDHNVWEVGSSVFYWSKTPNADGINAVYLFGKEESWNVYETGRCYGLAMRLVR